MKNFPGKLSFKPGFKVIKNYLMEKRGTKLAHQRGIKYNLTNIEGLLCARHYA